MHPNQLLTTEEMYKADAQTIASGTPGITLMENAGGAVANEITRRWQPRETLVCCGPGNNGGDGFVVARLLHETGWPVRLCLLGDYNALTGDALLAAQKWPSDIQSVSVSELADEPLVVDALYGAGLSRDLSGPALEIVRAVNSQKIDCVSIDVPSGIDGNTGVVRGDAPVSVTTVTFFRAKPAHFLMPARAYIGDLVVADIGIDETATAELTSKVYLNGPGIWCDRFPQPAMNTHKFARGHLLIAGGQEMTGAALLAADAARRIGAGLVTVAAPADVWRIYASHRPGLLVKKTTSLVDYIDLLTDPRIGCLLIGPGFGVGNKTREWVNAALASGKPIVLDADGLSAYADNPDELFERLHSQCVLTPHAGEFSRLFDASGHRLENLQNAVLRTAATILLKGPDTVIVNSTGQRVINASGTPYLATAGSGDVLAGLIAGLMTQGMGPFDAACAGTWMHGKAAELFGPGLIAEDIPELIPKLSGSIINLSRSMP